MTTENKAITFLDVLCWPRKEYDLQWDNPMFSLLHHGVLPGISETYPDYGFTVEDIEFFQLHRKEDVGGSDRPTEIGLMTYQGIEVLLWHNAGRGGFEYSTSYILSENMYREVVGKILVALADNNLKDLNVVNVREDAEALISFYGIRVTGGNDEL